MDGGAAIPHPVRYRKPPSLEGRFAYWLRSTFKIPSGMGAGEPFALEPFQMEFIRQYLAREDDGPLWRSLIYSTPRKLGKTTLLATVFLGRMCPDSPIHIPRFAGAVAAPSEKHSGYIEKAMRALMETAGRKDQIRRKHDPKPGIVLIGDASLILSTGTRNQGHGADLDLAVVDEAGLLAQNQGEMLTGFYDALTARNGQLILTGTRGDSPAYNDLIDRPDPSPLRPDVLAAMGLDLVLRGESCWHVRLEGGDLRLVRAAWWDELGGGRYHLHIAHPAATETVRALEGEVLRLTINAPAEQPWRGRSPFAMMGGSPRLMAEIEQALRGASEWIGRGLLPFPETVPEEQQSAAIRGLRGGGMLAAIRSKADFSTATGNRSASEFRRVELTPALRDADLNPVTDQLHNRVLTAAGIPPALVTPSGNAGAMREAYRLFCLQTVEPLARTLLPELAKIGVTSLSTRSMLSADVAGPARAVGTLVTAGVPLDQAMQLVGLGKDDGGTYE